MFASIKEYLLNDAVDRNTFHRTIFQLIVISSLTLLVFLNVFQNSFVIDDPGIFQRWPDVKNMDLTKLIQGSYPPEFKIKAYRPIKGVILAIEYKIWQQNTFFYHAQAILINLLIVITLFFITTKITKKPSIAFITSLLFGIHPLHTEAITFMTASLDSIGILFFFLSFYYYLRFEKEKQSSYVFSILFAFLAFFTYELTLTLPILIVLYDICFKNITYKNIKRKLFIYFPYIFLPAVFIGLRFLFIGSITRGEYFAGSIYLTILTMTKAIVKYLELFVFPVNLSINPTLPGNIQSLINNLTDLTTIKTQSVFDLSILFSISVILITILIAIYYFKEKPIISFCIFFIYISLLPVLNIIPEGVVMAERYAYISSFGAILLFGYLFNYVYHFRFKKINKQILQNSLIVFLILITVIFSFLTLKRNTDWKDELNVWTALSRQSVGGTLGDYYIGILNFQKEDYGQAIQRFNKVLDQNKDNKLSLYYLVIAYRNIGNLAMAKTTLDRLKTIASKSDSEAVKTLESIIYTAENPSSSSIQYKSLNLSFIYPLGWVINEKNNQIDISNPQKNFDILINKFNLPPDQTADIYIKSQNSQYGVLINQGLAQIPTVDYAYVKVWNDKNVQKMQFFLFKNKNVLEVIVFPSDSSEMREFDKIISSLKFFQ